MAAPTLYRSSDTSAPSLTGTAGDLINLLDKCLVSGYGSQAAAGWSRKTGFAGDSSTRAVFQQGAGNQFYLDVDDRGASSVLTSASGKEAAVRGYESMTDVGTGTNPFPITGQVAANAGNWRKSASADSMIRGWQLIADDRTFMLFIADGDINAVYKGYYFGDVYSLKSGDSYRTAITLRSVTNSPTTSGTLGQQPANSITQSSSGFYLARDNTGGVPQAICYLCLGSSLSGSPSLSGSLDGNIYLSRLLIGGDGANLAYLRGWFRGLYQMLEGAGINDGDTFSGNGDFAGRTFMVIKGLVAATIPFAVETTSWDTSS